MATKAIKINLNTQALKAAQKIQAVAGQPYQVYIDGMQWKGEPTVGGRSVKVVRKGQNLKLVVDGQETGTEIVNYYEPASSAEAAASQAAAPEVASAQAAPAVELTAAETKALFAAADGAAMVPASAAAASGIGWGTGVALGVVGAVGVAKLLNKDTDGPTLKIASDTAGAAKSPVTFTLTFDEDVTGMDISKLSVTHGSITGFTVVSPRVYTVTVDPAADSEGNMVLSVDPTGIKDKEGNQSASLGSYTQAYDTHAPTVEITDPSGGPFSGTTVFTFTFSEAVQGFSADNITLSAGDKGQFHKVSDSVYTLEVQAPAGSTGDIVVTTNTTGVTDMAGNAAVAPAAYTQAYDTVAPTVTITDNVAGIANGDITYTYTFSEAVTGFDASKITVANGTKGEFTRVSGTVYTLVVTPPANATQADMTLSTSTTGVVDAAGNVAVAPADYTQSYLTTMPTLSITDNGAGVVNGPVTFTYTFSEAVSGFDASHITVTNGTIRSQSFTEVTPNRVYTVIVDPTAGAVGDIVLTTNTTGVVNPANTQAGAVANYTQAFDTKPATVTITDNAAGDTRGAVTYTFAFDEDVTGFDEGKISVSAGTKGTFTKISPSVYTLLVTPPAGSAGTITLTTDTTNVLDIAGNQATAPAAYSQTYDTQAPTVTISDNVAGVASGMVLLTFTFSEGVTGFDASKVNLVGGTKGTFSTVSSTVYTLEATPPTSATGTMSVSLNTSGVTDAVGNTATAPANATQAYNTNVPSLVITDDTANTATGDVTYTFTFSEAVTGFDAADITVTNGTKGALTPVSSTVYTMVVSPTPGTAGNMTLAVATSSIVNNANTSVGTVASQTQAYDLAPPTVSSVTISGVDAANAAKTGTLVAGDKVKVVLAMSEATTVDTTSGAPTYTIDVGGVSKTATYDSGSGTNSLVFYYTVAAGDSDIAGGVTALADALALAGGSLKDAVGNDATLTTAAVAASANTVVVDTVAPTVSSVVISGVDATNAVKTGTLGIGDKVKVMLTMSEATTVTGTPTYTIDVGGVSKTATYDSGSGTNNLVFYYTIAAGDADASGGVTALANALSLAGGTLKDSINNASLATPAVAVGDNTVAIASDVTPPTVSGVVISGVDSTNATKTTTLVVGDKVKVTLAMSEATLVTGTPTYTIDVGGVSKTATYASGSGSTSLVFYYTVTAGDADSAGGVTALANALALGTGGALKDAAGNDATLTTAAVAAGANTVAVDTTVAALTLSIPTDTGLRVGDGITSTVNSSTGALATIGNLEAGASWEYKIGAGAWTSGTGTTFTLPVANYTGTAIQVRQTDAAGNVSAATTQTGAVNLVSSLTELSNWFSYENALASGGNESFITVNGQVRTLHSFTTVGADTFVSTANLSLDYLIIGGGGGGGAHLTNNNRSGGGGSAAQALYGTALATTAGSYGIVVGAGGRGAETSGWTSSSGEDGGTSSAFSMTAAKGEGGGGAASVPYTQDLGGWNGAGAGQSNGTQVGGVGTSGRNGGNDSGTLNGGGGGGGGAGEGGGGSNANNGQGGAGGDGVQYSITGQAAWYAGGGAGADNGAGSDGVAALGGSGVGGNGATGTSMVTLIAATAGAANTGSGGGASCLGGVGGAGGSGVVYVSYDANVNEAELVRVLQDIWTGNDALITTSNLHVCMNAIAGISGALTTANVNTALAAVL